jgi:hypothetical protein
MIAWGTGELLFWTQKFREFDGYLSKNLLLKWPQPGQATLQAKPTFHGPGTLPL